MIKCKYAGDVNDEYCATCNGCTMMVNGVEESCEKCAGYEVDKTEMPLTEPKPIVEETKVEEVTNDIPKEENAIEAKSEPNKAIVETPKNIKVKSIRYMSGCTIRRGDDLYYKFTAEEEWELPDECNIDEMRKALWNKVNDEIDKQVEDILK